MENLFCHAYAVCKENKWYRPVRFTALQLERLGAILPIFGDFARCPAGVSLKFYTDSEELAFSYEYTPLYGCASGFDVCENGELCANFAAPKEFTEAGFVYRKKNPGKTLVEIFLPATGEIRLCDFQLGNRSAVEKPQKKPLLFLGDSITQSGYIQNPSLSFANLVSLAVGAEYLNRGIGSMFYDAGWLDANDGYSPGKIFVCYGANDLVRHGENNEAVLENGKSVYCTAAEVPALVDRAREYLVKCRDIWPQAEIYLITALPSCENMTEGQRRTKALYNASLVRLASELKISCVEGDCLLRPLAENFCGDGIHLSLRGHAELAQKLVSML